MKNLLTFLAVILCSVGAFGQGAQYRPTPFANGFVQTVTSQGTAQTYLGIGSSTNNALLNGTNVFTGTNNFAAATTVTNLGNTISAASYGSAQQTLTYSTGTNITVDASKALHFVSLTNTAYFAQPTSLAVGASFTIHLRQDATGTRAVTFNTNYWRFPNGTVPTITTNANASDVISCVACPYGTNVFAVISQKFQ